MTPTSGWICRVFPHEPGDGAANMARDEALLDLVTREPDAAALRTYGWTEPTLSLGYFQTHDQARSDPRWRSAPLVRRPTGGGAIWHDRELTYALAIPRAHPLSRQSETLYRAVHGAIAALLAEQGALATRRGEGSTRPRAERPLLCFADRDAEDLVIAGSKVVGSAQRRRAGAILQHGSIVLSGSNATPEFPGVADLSSAPAEVAFWADRLRRHLPAALGFQAQPTTWPDTTRDHAQMLETTVYRAETWTRRR